MGESRKGSKTGTCAGRKYRTLPVAAVRPCSNVVAAMSKSALPWPRASDKQPQRRTVATFDGEDVAAVERQHAVQPEG